MKKTLTVNLNGRIFNIDEDAYELLSNYLSNLKTYFRKESDATEIILDFEARIEELFSEKIKLGYEIITIEEVEAMIKRMGKPEDFGEDEMIETTTETASDNKEESKPKKKFYRNVDNKILAGVCSGISSYFGWDPLPVRIIFFILIFLTSLWMIPVYLVLWIAMPAAITASQKLEMKGEAITLENIGKTVAETITTGNQKHQNEGCLSSILKVCTIGLGCIIGFPLLIIFFVVVVVLIAMLFGFGSLFFVPLDFFGFNWDFMNGTYSVIGMISLVIVIGIPLFSIIYMLFSNNKKAKPLSRTTKWIAFIFWIIALLSLMISSIKFVKQFNPADSRWNITWNTHSDSDKAIEIEEAGQIIDRNEDLPNFNLLKLDDNLIANVRIRQVTNEKPKMVINGDENIINKIGWKIANGRLELFVINDYVLKTGNNLIILITTPKINGVLIESFGSVTMENKIETTDFKVEIRGAGSFSSDSLYVSSLSCKLEGVGKLTLAGKAENALFFVNGAGQIDAKNLESRNVSAKLEGIGSIKTNPVELLNAQVDGVGKITYKNEPKNKKISMSGVGKVGKEE